MSSTSRLLNKVAVVTASTEGYYFMLYLQKKRIESS